jgi:hypothetical protein
MASTVIVSLAALLPFSGLIRDAVTREGWCAALLSDVYQRGTSLFAAVHGGNGLLSSQKSVGAASISVMNVQIHVVNAVLVLTFAHQYLASQRRYTSTVRDTACVAAVLLFAVHPDRVDLVGQVNETSVLHHLSICLSLVGVVLSMAFVTAAGTRRRGFSFVFAMAQAACSGAFLSAGAFLGGPVSALAIPLLFYAAVVLQQIRCHLSFLDAAVLTAMHGCWAATVAVVRADCASSGSTPAPLAALCRSATPGVMAAAFRGHVDAFVLMVGGAWREPERSVAAVEEYLSFSLLGFQDQLEAIAARSADGSSSVGATLNALVQLVAPPLATVLLAGVAVRSVRDAVRWKPMTNFNFCCLAAAAAAVGGGVRSYVPSAFLSVCLGEFSVRVVELCLL